MTTLSQLLTETSTDGPYGCYFTNDYPEHLSASAFHFGNHPIREKELKRQFSRVELVATFSRRDQAERACIEFQGLLQPWAGCPTIAATAT